MVNMCDALSGTSTATLQRQKSLFHTSFHSNTSNSSMGKHTHLDTTEHLLNIFQMWANTHTHKHRDWAYTVNTTNFHISAWIYAHLSFTHTVMSRGLGRRD